MAELTTLARPYAKAAFEFADNAGSLDSWSKALQSLAAVVAEPKVATALSNPLNTTEQNAQLVIDLLGEELDAKAQNFVRNIAANKRLPLTSEITQLFDLMKANREQALDVKIESAFDMSESEQTKLADALGKNLKRTVTLEVETDSSLIGGALIHAGDTLIDGSVKGRLAKLTDALGQ